MGYIRTVALLATLWLPNLSYAELSQWSLGAAAAYSPAVYKDTPANRLVIPVIGYEGEQIFLRGFTAGYRLLPLRSPHNVIFRLAYDPRTLHPKDSDDPQLRLLDKRGSTVLGGVSYQRQTAVGSWELTAGGDVAGQHNGLYAELAWRLPLRFQSWGVTPSIGYAYNSKHINHHLYGVSAAESLASGLPEFQAAHSGEWFIGSMAYWSFANDFRLSAGIRHMRLDSDTAASPVIGQRSATFLTFGLVYLL